MFNQKEYMKKYQQKNQIHLKKYMKKYMLKYRLKNKLKISKYNKQYKQLNKPILAKNQKDRELKDIAFKISNRLRHRIYSSLKSKNAKKNFKFKEYIGCSTADLISYLESKFVGGMTKENYGKWHIDHIIPCTKFNLTDPGQQKECFHYTNLQPLWAEENFKKGIK
jgi:hypothetical protein